MSASGSDENGRHSKPSRFRGFLRGFFSRNQVRVAVIALPFIVLVSVLNVYQDGVILGCVIGGVFLLLALVWAGQTIWMRCTGQAAKGIVVAHAAAREGGYFPVVEFPDAKGSLRREEADEGWGVKKPPVGSCVNVWYDPHGKLRCQIVNWSRWATALVEAAIGTIILLCVLRSRS